MLSKREKAVTAVGYLPFLGWFFPLFFLKKSSVAQLHARQSASISIYLAVVTALYRMTIFMLPSKWYTFIRLVALALFSLGAVAVLLGVLSVLIRKLFKIPVISNLSNILNI